MKERELIHKILGTLVIMLAVMTSSAFADEFSEADLREWGSEYMKVVNTGRENFTDAKLGKNGVACAQCHPNAANTHPETYPKFQKQLARVVTIGEMINWCLFNPLEEKKMALDSKKMVSLIAYITHERRNVPLAAGKH
jgi:thiosulfate dehydrogenase